MIVAANAGGVTEVTEKTAFDAVVAQGTVVVDFWAPWCKNCHRVAPVVTKLATELTGVKFVKVNTAEAEELSVELGVEALPTFLFYKDGKVVGDFKGSDAAKLEAAIRAL